MASSNVNTTLSAIDIKVSKAGAVETFNLGDLSTVVIDSVSYQAVSFTVEAGLNQIQAEATGDVQAVDLAYLKATAKPLA